MIHKDSCQAQGIDIKDVRIVKQICKEDDPTIISTHDAVYFEVKYVTKLFHEKENEFESMNIIQKRTDWEKADIPQYQALLDSLLEESFDIWQFPENMSILASTIPSTFILAAEIAAPSKTVKKPNYKIFKSEDWRKAELEAKAASKKWINAGRPRNQESDVFKAKKETNINLRYANL